MAPPEAWNLILITVFVNIVLAVSLNVVNGFTGQFSLGHAGFMAVGAYTAAKITLATDGVQLSFLPAYASDQRLLRAGAGRLDGHRGAGRPAGRACPRSACAATTWPS